MLTEELCSLDRDVVRATVPLVAQVRPDQLGRSTPCAEWTLRDLLAHMSAQHRGFAAAAHGAGPDSTAWHPQPGDPVADYGQAAEEVVVAFSDADALAEAFWLPDFTVERPIPAKFAVGAHLVDYVVHGWDVAVTLGLAWQPDPAAVRAAYDIAAAIPDGPNRLAPGAAFGPAVPAPDAPDADGAAPLPRMLAMLGRDPAKYRRSQTNPDL